MYTIILLKQRWTCVSFIITKIKKYEVWISRTKSAILQILLMLSEFNQTDVYRSVCEFYILIIIFRMHIKEAHHERNEENRIKNSEF